MQDGDANESVIENMTLFHLCHFAIIETRSTSFKLRKRMENSRFCVHVLLKTLNLVISRCCFLEDVKEMYQSLKHT